MGCFSSLAIVDCEKGKASLQEFTVGRRRQGYPTDHSDRALRSTTRKVDFLGLEEWVEERGRDTTDLFVLQRRRGSPQIPSHLRRPAQRHNQIIQPCVQDIALLNIHAHRSDAAFRKKYAPEFCDDTSVCIPSILSKDDRDERTRLSAIATLLLHVSPPSTPCKRQQAWRPRRARYSTRSRRGKTLTSSRTSKKPA